MRSPSTTAFPASSPIIPQPCTMMYKLYICSSLARPSSADTLIGFRHRDLKVRMTIHHYTDTGTSSYSHPDRSLQRTRRNVRYQLRGPPPVGIAHSWNLYESFAQQDQTIDGACSCAFCCTPTFAEGSIDCGQSRCCSTNPKSTDGEDNSASHSTRIKLYQTLKMRTQGLPDTERTIPPMPGKQGMEDNCRSKLRPTARSFVSRAEHPAAAEAASVNQQLLATAPMSAWPEPPRHSSTSTDAHPADQSWLAGPPAASRPFVTQGQH